VEISAICPILIAGAIQFSARPIAEKNGLVQKEVAVVDERVEEGHHEEDQDTRDGQQLEGLKGGELRSLILGRWGYGMKSQAEGGQNE